VSEERASQPPLLAQQMFGWMDEMGAGRVRGAHTSSVCKCAMNMMMMRRCELHNVCTVQRAKLLGWLLVVALWLLGKYEVTDVRRDASLSSRLQLELKHAFS
jgi:hypothetical protein